MTLVVFEDSLTRFGPSYTETYFFIVLPENGTPPSLRCHWIEQLLFLT